MRRALLSILATAFVVIVAAALRAAAAAPADVPLHVRDWIYYGGLHQNEDLPPEWVAEHVEFAEADAGQPQMVERFKKAGGRAAIMYTDPAFVPYCRPPFARPAGACDGPIGNRGLPEEAWLHAGGERVRREDANTHLYQEALNPASSAVHAAYRAFTEEAVAKAPDVDYFFADDSGSPLRGPDGSATSSYLYRFNAAAEELRDNDERYIAGVKALFASAARPVYLNGNEPGTMLPAYGGGLLRAPNVMGATLEGCFVASWFKTGVSDAKGLWVRQADGLLATTRLERDAVCLQQGRLLADPEVRLYGFASWLLTYDARHSVIGLLDGGSDGHAPFAEEMLVPREPLESAHRIADLRDVNGAYVRRFGACTFVGRALGPCAVVVNPSALGMARLPDRLRTFRRHLALDARSFYAGGTVHFADGAPVALAPVSAAILFR